MAELLTIGEMAKMLRVPKSWLYGKTRLKDEGAIPHLRVGKYIRFKEDSVIRWLKEQQESYGGRTRHDY